MKPMDPEAVASCLPKRHFIRPSLRQERPRAPPVPG